MPSLSDTLLSGVVLALIVGAAFAILLSALADLRRSQLREQRSAQVLTMANRLERLIIDTETGQRGFALTGQEQFLQRWREAIAAYPSTWAGWDGWWPTPPPSVPGPGRSPLRASPTSTTTPSPWWRRRVGTRVRHVGQEPWREKHRVDAMRADFDALVAAEQSLAPTQQQRSDAAAGAPSSQGSRG
ncbi:CHASE3 domain-containing protein [Nonomuraea turcica]|uniref:CHASE3 domain-containing protein n=1 Tax=Nonomuraea sp. G32 TaxID=3067274 RepID=UPI00273AB8C6|nr:CHASE3 domain-containing protein [Nonomuraea sp. G32]MDP4506948.1 CHASE3 domain-containing protein [Nonomuraea sp. G32]